MKIQPKLGALDLTMIIISLVIGVGIFKTSSIVAQKAGTPFIFYMAWLMGGIIAIFGALTFAEIGARLPAAGGFYKIFSYCYHPAFAFMINWAQLIARGGSAAAIALVGAEYIRPVLLPASMQTDLFSKIIALTVIFILFVLNYIGMKTSAQAQNILSTVKMLLVLLFCTAVFGAKSTDAVHIPLAQSHLGQLKAFALSLIPVFYTWNGYQYILNFGADVKDPQRNIPRSVFWAVGFILVLYLIINIAYCQVIGFENLKGQSLVAATLSKSFFGDIGYKITSIVIFISVVGFINTAFMSNPRLYYAMAEDKILPVAFKKVNPKTQVQEFALFFFFMLMLLCLLFLDTFEKILNHIIFIDSLALILGTATVFILRRRMAASGYSGFVVKPMVIIPVLFILFLIFICVSVLIADPIAAITGTSLLIIGFPLYYIIKRLLNTPVDEPVMT